MLPPGTHVCLQWPSLGFYHRARLRALGNDLRAGDCRLTALQTASGERAYPWHGEHTAEDVPYEIRTVFPDTEFETLSPDRIHRGVRSALETIQPDVVATNSYSFPDAREALEWGRRNRRSVVVMTDSRRDDARRHRWREWVKRRLLRGFDAGLAAGIPQEAYLRELGLPSESIWTGYDVVDNAYFSAGRPTDEFTGGRSGEYFLSVGRMKALKNFDGLLRAYERYRSRTDDPWPLVLVGDGPERERLEALARKIAPEDVRFAGFQPPDRLRDYYAGAGALVHPAKKDTWGLVVNEAMAAGLPVLVSRAAGCVHDLVETGENGFTFDPTDPDRLADLMRRLDRSSDEERRAMGRASREIVADWDLDRFSRGLRSAARFALNRPDRGLSIGLRLLLGVIRRLARSTDSFHTAEV